MLNDGNIVEIDNAAVIGERTMAVFAKTPRLNAWLYSKFAEFVRGDVLEIGSGNGTIASKWCTTISIRLLRQHSL